MIKLPKTLRFDNKNEYYKLHLYHTISLKHHILCYRSNFKKVSTDPVFVNRKNM